MMKINKETLENNMYRKMLGTDGLTETSANHVSDLAALFISRHEDTLDNMRFYDETVEKLDSDKQYKLHAGWTKAQLDAIPGMLDEIGKAKALIAWMREGVKAKETLLRCYAGMYSFDEFLKDHQDEGAPKSRYADGIIDTLSEEDIINEMSVKERARYYALQAECANIGKAIHKDGCITLAKKSQMNAINNPTVVDDESSEKDTLIRQAYPSVSTDDIDALIFSLQKTHREKQAQLNKITYGIKDTLTERNLAISTENERITNEFNSTLQLWIRKWETCKTQMSKEISKLKIIIPDDLKDIYEQISQL